MNNRRALVCGASQGIGLACAQLLAAAGVQVLLLARGAEKLQCALATLVPHPAGHRSLALDVNALDALVQAITAELQHGTIDILINNTGGPPPGPIASATSAQFQAAFHQHLLVNHTLAGLLVPGMRASGFGRIVNVISTSVKEPLRDLGVSNTVRAAVAAWAKTLAGELAPFGITVNNVLPGYTKTARLEAIVQARMNKTGQSSETVMASLLADVPAGRAAEAPEIAAAVGFLCSDAAAYVTGINIPVDGGRTRSL
jgi:3-oxoacyl-[acyl-carrier protein] reductase